ncbi:MAG: hypothetical protein HYT73_03455 [Candidatus Aenigmarchaeota archaeon]|nr:hypothetical protein [Candidatus Aenigmarchaeota archaeon]
MKDLAKYYRLLSILIPLYIAIGFVAERNAVFNYFNAGLAVFWVIMVFAWFKFRKSARTFRKK